MFKLVIGGSGSGKSEYAEEEITKLGERRRIYIATMKPWDEECVKRIARHRLMRAEKQFETLECYENLLSLDLNKTLKTQSAAPAAVLLECLSNLVSNELFEPSAEPGDSFLIRQEAVVTSVLCGISHIKHQVKDLIVVTNEVFSDGDDYDSMTNAYRQVLGRINQALAQSADQVVEIVAGIPIFHLGVEPPKQRVQPFASGVQPLNEKTEEEG